MKDITEKRGRLNDLRESLAGAQQAGVFASHPRLSLAARETLKRLSDALEAYDEQMDELLEAYRAETEEGRPIRVAQIAGRRVDLVRVGGDDDLDPGWYQYPINGEANKLDPEVLAGAEMGIKLEDGDEYHELKEEYAQQETDVKIDPVEEELFSEHASWNEQAEETVDLLLLRELWLTN